MKSHGLTVYVVSNEPESEIFTPQYSKPEKILLAAILERAFRDLFPSAPKLERKSAIQWFLETQSIDEHEREGFTFPEVADALELGACRVNYLLAHVEMAEEFEQYRITQTRKLLKEKFYSVDAISQVVTRKWCDLKGVPATLEARKRIT